MRGGWACTFGDCCIGPASYNVSQCTLAVMAEESKRGESGHWL